MGEIITRLAQFFNPVVALSIGMGSIISFLLGALANPSGLWNEAVNKSIDTILVFIPDHPVGLTLGSILTGTDSLIPQFGAIIISEVALTVGSIFAIIALIKIYKLIPFKFT